MAIVIIAYQPRWVDDFARLRARLAALLPDAGIHHIGSTAVPGLAAKDVIDIQVGVGRLQDVDVAALEEAGFAHRPGRIDHAPAGVALARADLEKLFFHVSAPQAANIHVREVQRFNHRYGLLCRDYLRAHPEAAAAYGLVKQRLATQLGEDFTAYYAIKDPVFDIMMAGAEEWADAIGWRAPDGR